jgi:phage FluMu protein Com
MAIESICDGCGKKLRVADEFAGRKARCPHCKTVYTVSSGSSVEEMWRLRNKDGTIYGPVPKSELDGWMHEGRLDATSQIQKDGETHWQEATELYPMLLPKTANEANPFASDPSFSARAANPYSSPQATGRSSRASQAHRGGLILTLSILGILCCQIFSIAAWVMGRADMKEINAGRMDPEGRGLTQAGMIIGIIGTAFLVMGTCAQILFVLFAILSGG